MDLDIEINIDFEGNSPYQESIISETYKRLDRSYFTEPSELTDLIDTVMYDNALCFLGFV